jgi:hypothetical protein
MIASSLLQHITHVARAKPGDLLQLYTGQRTKACHKLLDPDPVCVMVDYVSIRPEYLTLGDTRKQAGDADAFAVRDGFEGYEGAPGRMATASHSMGSSVTNC